MQEGYFSVNAASISRRLTISSQNTMAGNDDRNGVMPYCTADSLRRHILARPFFDLFRNLSVCRRLAIGNLTKNIPDQPPEITALRSQGQCHDGRHPPGKIFIHPVRRFT